MAVGDGFGANQIAPQIGAEMRSIEAAENAVPVGVVALRAEEQVARLRKLVGRLRILVAAREPLRCGAETRSIFLWSKFDSEYLRKKPRQEPPRRKESTSGRAAELLLDSVVALADARRQNPLHHFRVGGSRQIGAAQRRVSGEIFAGCGDMQPGGIFLERGEELFEPAVLVAMIVGSGPDAEFFHVVAHGGHAAGMQGRCFAQDR